MEWNYTDGRAAKIVEYIKENLKKTREVELWHVWLMDYYEYEDSPVIHKRTISIGKMTTRDIKEIDSAEIWNKPDKNGTNYTQKISFSVDENKVNFVSEAIEDISVERISELKEKYNLMEPEDGKEASKIDVGVSVDIDN
mgnify:CR=1 FL=1